MPLFPKHIDRQPVAAGRFYSAHAEMLETEIGNMASEVNKLIKVPLPKDIPLLALVSPHAGYVFSGKVSVSAFLQLKSIAPRKRVFLIGSSHHADFNGASIYNIGDYITPLGKLPVDIELANKLIEQNSIFEYVNAAHAHEHSIEVQLPFLQYFWKEGFEIIPIIMATQSKETCEKVADALLPYFNPDNLFVISTDLSHYPGYSDALKVDKATIDAVLTGMPDILILQIERNKDMFVPNLATSMCGWTSVLTLLYLMQKSGHTSIYPILYQNSGDAGLNGEKDRVVGYQSMAVYQEYAQPGFLLSDEDKSSLLQLARKSIRYYQDTGNRFVPDINDFSKALQTACGAFVSIYLDNELRGCIGRIIAKDNALAEVVSDVAVSAAFFDNRFKPLTHAELDSVNIEISVLTPLRKIESLEELELGRHGIYIKKGVYSGTFLPQVANKRDWTKEEFVSICARDKAGIGYNGWKEAEIYSYEAIVFKG